MWSPDRRERAEARYYGANEGALQLLRASSAPAAAKNSYSSSSATRPSKLKKIDQLPPLQRRMLSSKLQEESQMPQRPLLNTARYLHLKNQAQRTERKIRQDEEAVLQERVNDHLASLLRAHKQHKKEMMAKWSSHASAPIPKAPPPNAVARRREEERLQQEQDKEDRKARAREETRRRLQRGTMLEVKSDKARSSSDSTVRKTMTGSNNNDSSSQTAAIGASGFTELDAADARASANFAQIAQIYETVLQPQKSERELEATTTEIPLDFVPHSIEDMKDLDEFGPLLVCLTPDQRRRLRQIDKKHEKTQARLLAQEAMFEAAKRRRRVASDRIREDPPADVLVQADLRRYIPADLLETIPELGGNENNARGNVMITTNNHHHLHHHNVSEKSTVFLTDVVVVAGASNDDDDDEAMTKKERKVQRDKEKQASRADKGESRRQSLAAAAAATTTTTKLSAETSSKQRALVGGPLRNAANNKKMTIFAREVLMKVATAQAAREEREQMKVERERDEKRRRFAEAGVQPPRDDLDDDDDVGDDGDDDQLDEEAREAKAQRRRLEEAHRHDYDHFFADCSNSNKSADYLKMNIAREQQAAVEWYRKYHTPLVSTSTKNKALLGAKASSGAGALSSAVLHQQHRQQEVVDQWKAKHKPVAALPRPSRTLFFDSERPKEDLRTTLF